MGFFDKLRDPVFLKEDSSAQNQLAALEQLRDEAVGTLADELDEEICRVKAGLAGEKSVHFELENSHIPMYVLHDLYLEHDGLTAQIDYLIITHAHQYVLECKNLYGNIEINNSGDFIRTVKYGKHLKKEGIYSPITQNRRHLELIKEIRSETKANVLMKKLFENDFYHNYRSVVVLSNPKTVLYDRYAKKEIKSQVIRADQLAEYIRKTDAEPKSGYINDRDMAELGEFFLGIHQAPEMDYTEKYRVRLEEQKQAAKEETEDVPKTDKPENRQENAGSTDRKVEQVLCPKCGAPMIRRKAAKGAYAGREFYGCSNYPKCRGIVNIAETGTHS